MDRAITEIDHFFRMPQRKTAIAAVTGVSRIGCGGSVAAPQRRCESAGT